jgi:serpin B
MDAGVTIRGLTAALAVLLLPAATAQPVGRGGPGMQVAATAQNTFGLRLLAQVAGERRQENVFLSPTSVFLALAMAETGAAGSTRAAIRSTLDVPATVSEQAIQESAAALSKALRSREGVDLAIANALWADSSFPLAPAFVRQCREWFEADAFTLEFRGPGAADTINAWVKRNTKDKIPSIVTPEVLAESRAILTNAVYFKGAWRNKFSRKATQNGPFHLARGRQKQVPLMHQSGLHHAYVAGDGFEAAVMPYQNSGMALYALLPASGKSPEEVLSKVSVHQLLHADEPCELDLRIPRFTLDFSHSLKKSLEHMGMAIAFQAAGADFAPLGSPRFFIGDVQHKTRLEIDEEGTVAAAVTGVMVGSAMARPLTKKTLVFDRPFALLLADGTTETILFAGVIYDP